MATIFPSSKIAKKFKPTKATAPFADKRPLLEGGRIEQIAGRNLLVVTDGRIAIRLPVHKERTGEEIPEGYVSAHALRLMEKSSFDLTEELVKVGRARSRYVNGEWVDGEPLVQLARIEPGKSSEDGPRFPDVGDIWPEKRRRALRVSLDTKLMRRLAEALASDALTLEIDMDGIDHEEGSVAYDRPLIAFAFDKEQPTNGPDGLLMPMRDRIEPEGKS